MDVYTARLEPEAARLDLLYELLSAEERERAGRFHFPIHRGHFVACRGMLREILSGYLEIPPAQVRFSYNAYGKPAVQESGVRFNVSHSGGGRCSP